MLSVRTMTGEELGEKLLQSVREMKAGKGALIVQRRSHPMKLPPHV